MEPYPTVSYETKVLEQLQVGLRKQLSRYMMQQVDVNAYIDHMTQSMVAELRARVYADPVKYNKTHRVEYDAEHPSWAHHFVAELPRGSFLRRWASGFWGIPEDYRKTRVVKELSVDAQILFPEAGPFPDSLGTVQYFVTTTPSEFTYVA